MNELHGLHLNWPEIKAALNAAEVALQSVCSALPIGVAKSIVCGVAAGLQLVINLLPNSEAAK
jgi:hypothetical protein